MSLDSLCATCDICTFMPEQKNSRVLLIYAHSESKILFIDDQSDNLTGFDMASVIAQGQPFDYTQTIRCTYPAGSLVQVQEEEALQRCSVWTKNIVGNYSIHLCTKNALNQLGIGDKRQVGDVFHNSRLGLVLCISTLGEVDPPTIAEYQSKLKRMLKKAGIK